MRQRVLLAENNRCGLDWRPVTRRPTLLLAEDDTAVATALVRVLREDFNIVGVVADGATLIAHAIQLQADAIVADVHLQTLDGITATIDIRRRDPVIPIVLMTGDDDSSLRSRALAAGASAFVRKLEGADSLVAVLQDLLR